MTAPQPGPAAAPDPQLSAWVRDLHAKGTQPWEIAAQLAGHVPDPPQVVQAILGVNGSATAVPPGRLDPVERAELAELRGEVTRMRKREGGRIRYVPGMGLPAHVAWMRPDLEQDYQAEVEQATRDLRVRQDARRALDAGRWVPPPVAASLAAELVLPRETLPHRITGMAGWRHNVLVAGERKSGKTQLIANLTAGLSGSSWRPYPHLDPDKARYPADGQFTGGRFLAPPLPSWPDNCFTGRNVGYLNGEMDADDWRDVFRAMPPGCYAAGRIRPLHFRGLPFPVITNQAAREWFTGWLRANDIEVLIIDTWGALASANGIRNFNDDAEARAITTVLDEIKAAGGVDSLFVLVHMPHQTGERHLERFKAAGALGDWADTLWTYVRDSEGIRYLWAEGRARISMAETALSFDRQTGMLTLAGGTRETRAKATLRERILAAVTAQDGIGAEDLKDAVGGHRNDAAAAIRDLVSEGALKVEKRGNAKLHHLPTTAGSGQ